MPRKGIRIRCRYYLIWLNRLVQKVSSVRLDVRLEKYQAGGVRLEKVVPTNPLLSTPPVDRIFYSILESL